MSSFRSSAIATAFLAALAVAAPASGPASEVVSTTQRDFVPFDEHNPALVKRWANWDKFGEFSGWSQKFQDGQGTYVESGDEARYGFLGTGEHCWTDLFWVKHRIDAANWQRDESSVDCGKTSNCFIQNVKSGERCTSWDLHGSISGGFGTDIMAKFLGYTGEIGFEAGGGAETCLTSESQVGCNWDDKLCHTAWRSDLTLVHEGYIRRRCDKGGDHTVWMHDYEARAPIKETRVGCAALCTDMSYPDPVPSA
ncbi:uncharacterized protein JN550_005869 [Neoarthrinium moseri]|uniref:uncharacterized protein n=1 Tax=Neoarthrinium moseri TaxID=1658444 RepID=UPI001FDC7ADA|nr:uncharacterized protein JN550_005869 [Neoarthrinium moseri]KAI1869239.1 hypothetical protein JN550_005869 [Neoarthrinium moseri]